jgi:hypothetical protein
MQIPSTIQAGDTVSWIDASSADTLGNAVTSTSWTLTYYLRFNAASEAATVVGSARSDGGWNFTVSAATSAGFDAGTWYWQALATSGSDKLTLGAGTFAVKASLSYTGTAGAFNGQSQAEQDLVAVQAAIRAIVSKGAKQYSIGSRSFTSNDLGQLMEREAQLKAIVARERVAEKVAAGLGDPRSLFVRFG